MSAPIEAGLWEEDGVREVHGLGLRFKTVDELKARGYAFAFEYGSEALAKAFAWLKGEQPCSEDGEDLALLVAMKKALFALAEDPELADARAVLASLKRQGFILRKEGQS